MSWYLFMFWNHLYRHQILLDDRVVISDFGFAKLKENVSSTMTMGIGTLRWMAPGE